MTDRDTLADELLRAIDRAEIQMRAQYGPPLPGYRDYVRLEHDGTSYIVSVHRELVGAVHLNVGQVP